MPAIKHAIILATFGSTDDESRKIFDKLASEIKKIFPDCEIRTAFTSKIIIRKLKSQNIFVPTVDEAISSLRNEGFTKIFVLPTLLTQGEEFDNKILPCKAPDVEIIPPLFTENCSTPFDKKVFATISDCFTHETDEILILVGHGSPKKHNPVCENLQKLSDNVIIGVLEPNDTPNFDDVVAKLPAKSKIFLAPLLFNGGMHLTRDISGFWRENLIKLGHKVRVSEVGLSFFEEFRSLYIEKLREVMTFGRKSD